MLGFICIQQIAVPIFKETESLLLPPDGSRLPSNGFIYDSFRYFLLIIDRLSEMGEETPLLNLPKMT